MSAEQSGQQSQSNRKWVVGHDGSGASHVALRWAAEIAAARAVDLEVVSAWQYPYLGFAGMAGSAIAGIGPEMGAALLAETRETAELVAGETGARITARTMLGPAAQVLLEASEEAEVIVVGARGRGGFARLLLGSVSQQVANHAACPTIVVPADVATKGRVGRALVAVDGSDTSMAGLRFALEFCDETTEIVALHAWSFPSLAYGFVSEEDQRAAQADVEAAFDADIDRFESEEGCSGRIVRTFVAGLPSEAIAELGADADLVVVGARSHKGVAAAVLGSVTTHVLHHLRAPTVVVPGTFDSGRNGGPAEH